MAERIALIGFVNTEEILADTIRTQTPSVQTDGYELFPNEAFGRIVDNRYPLYGVDAAGEFGLHHLDSLEQIARLGYSAVNLGPIPAAMIAEDILVASGLDYIGPRKNELDFEIDKARITEVFPETSGVLPPTQVLETSDPVELSAALDELGGDVVLKFVGDYTQFYSDSETRRVRMIDEFTDSKELEEFVANSVEASGKVVLQQRIEGQQFSYTAIVDGQGGLFRLGENICYKHRFDGETGPLGDGTGSVSIGNSLPWMLGSRDISYIEKKIVRPYVEHLESTLGRSPKTFLNIDLIRDKQGKIFLLEVNNREPGGHTAADLLGGLATPLAEVLEAAQSGRLHELTPRYLPGASVVVSAYPANFPYPFTNEDQRPLVRIPKLQKDDRVKTYTGWVDVEDEDEASVLARAKLSPTMLFATHAPSLAQARNRVYRRIAEIVPEGFDYRKDIGK
jgi:phosphoribosylamine-glycine ligase